VRKPDDHGRLEDILEAIKRIELYLHDMDEKKFEDDLMCQNTVML